MDAAAILNLSERAARSVRKRHDLRWTPEDYEDACQEAAAGIVRALRDGPQDAGEGYYVRAGQQAVARYAFRKPEPAQAPLYEQASPVPQSRPSLFDGDVSALRAALTSTGCASARGGPRTRDQSAVARDLVIIQMLHEGSSRAGIAHRLGTTKNNVDGYISMLRRRLARLI